MANNCLYNMEVVAKNKEALERLGKIMNYQDTEYFISRVFSADCDNIEDKGDGFFQMHILGDVAWSCKKWFETEEDFDEKSKNGAHYITLDLLCEKLDLGIELYSEESGCEFQEHYHVNHKGEILISDCEKWEQEWVDDDGNDLDEPITIGGFDDYCCFKECDEIYD